MKTLTVLLMLALAGCASHGARDNRTYAEPGRVETSYGLPNSPHTF